MKRLFFFCFVFVWCVTAPVLARAAKPWGILKAVPEDTSFSVYGVDNLIDKRPIRYAVSEEVTPEQEKIFAQNILKWPKGTLRLIKRAGREEEFADIRDILLAGEVFKASSEEEPDILLSLLDEFDKKNATGYAWHKGEAGHTVNLIEIKRDHPDFAKIALHELGHYFGLADQYEQGRGNAHAEYSSDVNEKEGAIMQSNSKAQRQITCDDADGFINLIDLRLSQRHNGQFSTRAQNGWKSLCPSSKNIYKKAKTINRNEHDLLVADILGWSAMTDRTYKEGQLTRTTNSSLYGLQIFSVTPQDTVTRDSLGRITQVLGTLEAEDNQTEAQETVVWERQFVYKPATKYKGGIYVPIVVTEKLNGTKLRERTLFVAENGTLTGNINFELIYDGDPYFYMEGANFKMGFILDGSQITEFKISILDEDALIVGFPKDKFVLFYKDGRLAGKYSLPLKDREIPLAYAGSLLFFVKDIYQPQQAYFQSYYKNFYEPLFPSTQGQKQLLKKIKQNLHVRSR